MPQLFAVAAAVAPVVVIVVIAGGLIVVLLITDLARRFFASLLSPCGLVRQTLLPDKCLGACTAPGVCRPLTGPPGVRPYGPWGILGMQDAACTCALLPGAVPPAAPAAPGGSGTSGTGTAGSSNPSGSDPGSGGDGH